MENTLIVETAYAALARYRGDANPWPAWADLEASARAPFEAAAVVAATGGSEFAVHDLLFLPTSSVSPNYQYAPAIDRRTTDLFRGIVQTLAADYT